MAKYRKKPIVIEAMQYTGKNYDEIYSFCAVSYPDKGVVIIPTLEGKMICNVGDWVIKGAKGEFYPCKPDIFEKIYEVVDESE